MAKIIYLPRLAVLETRALAVLSLQEKLIVSIRMAKQEKARHESELQGTERIVR